MRLHGNVFFGKKTEHALVNSGNVSIFGFSINASFPKITVRPVSPAGSLLTYLSKRSAWNEL